MQSTAVPSDRAAAPLVAPPPLDSSPPPAPLQFGMAHKGTSVVLYRSKDIRWGVQGRARHPCSCHILLQPAVAAGCRALPALLSLSTSALAAPAGSTSTRPSLTGPGGCTSLPALLARGPGRSSPPPGQHWCTWGRRVTCRPQVGWGAAGRRVAGGGYPRQGKARQGVLKVLLL